MIRLGLRLSLNGGRETVIRLLVTAAGVALGVGMLLITLAGINAVNHQNAKYAWLETGSTPAIPATSAPGNAPLWWLLTADEFHGQEIGRVDVAMTGPTSAVPPGVSTLPGPGQYYASPALSRLLHSTPAAELADRFPGHEIGTIGSAGLPSPKSLIILIGRTPKELSGLPQAQEVTSISTITPSQCNGACYYIGIDSSGIDLVLAITAAALLFPVLIFIGTATRLSTARREQRFAAMRLVGATPQQISVISAVDSLLAGVIGTIGGFGLFFLLRILLAPVAFTGTPFFTSDIALNPVDILAVAVGVPVAGLIAARIALRRVQTAPLGVTRRVTPRPPRAYRLIPLLAGLGELAYFVHAGRPATTAGQTQAYLSGILVTMAGLVVAGPWLTMVGARLMARRTRRPSTLIAARRLSDNPQAGFRAISGLVLAMFVTSIATVMITTIHGDNNTSPDGVSAHQTLIDSLLQFNGPGPPTSRIRSLPGPLTTQIHSVAGVTGLSLVRGLPDGSTDQSDQNPGPPKGVVSCAQLAATPSIGRCPAGASAVTITPSQKNFGDLEATHVVWPSSSVPVASLSHLPILYVIVDTTGSTAAIEQVRTDLERAYGLMYMPATIAEINAQDPNTQRSKEFQQLVDVVILASLPIAGCGLAVSVIAGLGDRRRPFSLLRLTGAPLSLLRRVIAIEAAVPLIAISVFSIAVGFLAAGLFLKSQMRETLHSPGASYYLVVLGGLIVSLGVIATTFPLIERTTGPEAARND